MIGMLRDFSEATSCEISRRMLCVQQLQISLERHYSPKNTFTFSSYLAWAGLRSCPGSSLVVASEATLLRGLGFLFAVASLPVEPSAGSNCSTACGVF